jgi:tetratricopeptide (TPR) repeat protein/glycosyltransferase involved in cell wall biosynthesis
MTVAHAAPKSRAEATFDRAVRLHLAGSHEDAILAYREVLRLEPEHAPACNNLGTLLAQQAKLDEAEALFGRAVAIQPDYGEAHNNTGLVRTNLGDHAAAAEAFTRAVATNPGNASWENNLGNALVELFRFRDACQAYDRAVEIDGSVADYWSNRGLALRGLREPEEAIRSLRRALEIAPAHVNALSNLGVLLKEERRTNEAIETLQRAIDLAPRNVALYTNLASVYERLGDGAEVRRCARAAIAIDPAYPESWNLLANMEMEDGEYDQALEHYQHVISLDPGNRNANWNLALIWLLRGDFERGWKQFEWRKRLQSVVFDHGDYGANEWTGDPLNGRSILLHSEQGIGDAIQFVRYAAELVRHGAGRVVIECPWPIVPLLTGVAGVDAVFARGTPLPSYDLHANMMSLPGLLGTTLSTIPDRVPYIPSEPRPVVTRVASAAGLKVGFCWAGNPGHARDFLRSAPVEEFLALAATPGTTFFSLQKGTAAESALAAAGLSPVVNLAADLTDFRDTAAAIDALDLVITVDTSVAHLAGALGKPTWLLLPRVPDFRWMLEREDSPWYPTMRLFRQGTARDWQPVFERVRRELQALTRGASLRPSGNGGAASRAVPTPESRRTPEADVVTVASARRTPDGRPRFDLWVPLAALADPPWFNAWREELLGDGHERALRQFIAELELGPSTFIDVAPAIGISTIDVLTGDRAPRAVVLVEPNEANAARIAEIAALRAPTVGLRSMSSVEDAFAALRSDDAVIVRIGNTEDTRAVVSAALRRERAPDVLLWPNLAPATAAQQLDKLTARAYTHLALRFESAEVLVDPITDNDAVQCVVSLSPRALARMLSEPDADETPGARPVEVARQIGIDWELRSDTGWGIYGTNLAIGLLQPGRPSPELFAIDLTGLTPISRHALDATIDRARQRVAAAVAQTVAFPGLMLRALGNNLAHGPLWDRVRAPRNAGVVFLEDTEIDEEGRQRGDALDLIIAGSTWNAEVLRAAGIDHVTTVLQGIDPAVFHPAPRSGLLADRFIVFSGGKLEYRKGQDLVIAAFRRFRERHPEALLMAAWHNNWPQLIADLDLAGHVHGVPAHMNGRLDLESWVRANGIPGEAFVDIGHQPNVLMAQYIREASIAIFPNRCEGGTNLVAMECMASGIPTVVSANTGHLDLIATGGCASLSHQLPVTAPTRFFRGVDGWGESDVDEMVAAMEQAWTDRAGAQDVARRGAYAMSTMTWQHQVPKLLDALAPLW